MAKALTFDLSKAKTKAMRLRMLSHLLNIGEDLEQVVAQGFDIKNLPDPLSAGIALELNEMVERDLRYLRCGGNPAIGEPGGNAGRHSPPRATSPRPLGPLQVRGLQCAAKSLLAKAGLPEGLDRAFLPASDAAGFLTT